MRAENKKRSPSCTPGPVRQMPIVILLITLLLFIGPVTALPPSADGSPVDESGNVVGSATTHDTGTGYTHVTAAADSPIRVRPTPTPPLVKQNRTPILPIVAKNVAERPKVTLPATWFIVIVAVAFIGLAAILYLLLRKGAGTPAVAGKHGKEPAGHVTVIDVPVPSKVPGAKTPGT